MTISFQDNKSILQQVDSLNADEVYDYQNKSEQSKSQFLHRAFLDNLRSITNIAEFSEQVYKFYQWNSLVFTVEIRNAYDDLLEDSYHYKWNVPISDIVKRIEDINKAGIIYTP